MDNVLFLRKTMWTMCTVEQKVACNRRKREEESYTEYHKNILTLKRSVKKKKTNTNAFGHFEGENV